MDDLNPAIRRAGIIKGLLFGVILLIINIAVIYITAYKITSPVTYFIVSIILPVFLQIALAIYFVNSLRKSVGGYWTLKQATTGIFFMFLLTYFVSSAGRWVFSNYADAESVKRSNSTTLEMRRLALKSKNVPSQQIDITIKELKQKIAQSKNLNWPSLIQNLLFSIILLFTISVVFAALFKRESYTTPHT